MNRVYDFTLTASTASVQRIDAPGQYFKVRAASAGPVGVKLDGGPEIICDAGQGLRGVAFRDIVVRNLQAVANVGSIFIGQAGYEDSRITGEVSVIDSSRARTLEQSQFFGGTSNAADAANMCVISLRLSAAMQALAKRIAVHSVEISSPVAGDVMMGSTSNVGTAIGGVGTTNYQKLLQGTVPGAIVGAGVALPNNSLAAGEGPNWQQLGARTALSASMPYVRTFRNPVVITGTNVMCVLGIVANRQLGAAFEWEEF